MDLFIDMGAFELIQINGKKLLENVIISRTYMTENNERDLSHSMAHYLLTIHKLKETKGYARVTDIAKEMNLTKGSVSTALNNLKKRSLIREEEDSKFLILTDEGHEEVHQVLSSRTLLYYFLKDFVGVSESTALKDSCNMEHLMSSETSEKFFGFLKDLACSCEQLEESGEKHLQYNYKSTLDLCKFKDVGEFVEEQKGDKHLES
jgi:DtxR family transcriptional regulator, Mn-dependent transcriptional regulator